MILIGLNRSNYFKSTATLKLLQQELVITTILNCNESVAGIDQHRNSLEFHLIFVILAEVNYSVVKMNLRICEI